MQNPLILILTYRCNLNCRYCPVVKKKIDMSWPIAKKSIDLYLLTKVKDKSVKFFGGEPLLKYDLVKRIIKYTNKQHPNMKFEITSNGILLDENKLHFFIKNKIETRVSIDGDRKTQIEGRGIGSDVVLDSLKDRRDVIVNIVICSQNVRKFYNNLKWLYKEGYCRFNFLPAFFTLWTQEDLSIFQKELNKIAIFLKKHPKVYVKNKDILKKEYLFNEGYVIDYNGDIYGTNKIMTKKYRSKKKYFKRGNIKKMNDFEDMGDIIHGTSSDDKDIINKELDLILSNFVESL